MAAEEVTSPWHLDELPESLGQQSISLVDGTTFMVSDVRGDARPDRPEGLFVRDTRVLSRWQLHVDGAVPAGLHQHQRAAYAAQLRSYHRSATSRATLLVTRERTVGDGMHEELSVHNCGARPVRCELLLRVEADHADLFDVKEGRPAADADTTRHASPGGLRLSSRAGAWSATTAVDAAPPGALTPEGLHWSLEIAGHATWTCGLNVSVVPIGSDDARSGRGHGDQPRTLRSASRVGRQEEWRRSVPRLTTDHEGLARTIAVSVEDLESLRIHDPEAPDLPVVAAGAPWFMALFGRDSLLTSLMTLPYSTSLAAGTLRELARHQGRRHDQLTEEQPGKVLHELRFGPSTSRRFGRSRAYFGSVDATPLFVMTAGALLRWGGPDELADLLDPVDAALSWITGEADPDGDGFLEYERLSPQGLPHQGWKDSPDAITFADGEPAEPPIALAEVQAYAYAAFRERAHIAEVLGDRRAASAWHVRAARLRSAFDDRFWMPEQGCYALALDGHKRQVDAITSNAGHCLWAGIARPERARDLAKVLMSTEMFSGWGLRTLSSAMGAFDPMSYHNGSIWPHDTALCASGLARYGFRQEAARITVAMVEAAGHFHHRLPEVFCGFAREEGLPPLPYPAACAPQAWAAAAPLEMLRSLLMLRPEESRLVCDAHVPQELLPLSLENVTHRGRRWSLHVHSTTAATLLEDPPSGGPPE